MVIKILRSAPFAEVTLHEDEIIVITAADEKTPKDAIFIDDDTKKEMSFHGLCARRPWKGTAVDMKFVSRDRDLIQHSFDTGALAQGKKMTGGGIREEMHSFNITQYDVPGAHSI